MLIPFRKNLRQLVSSVLAGSRISRRRLRLPRTQGDPVEQLEKRELLTVTYQFVHVQNLELTQGPTTSQPAITELSNGGFAVSGTGGGNTDIDIFNSDLTDGGGANNLTGTNSAIAQLQTGNLVIVSQDSDSVRYALRSPTGATVLASTDTNDIGTRNPDVAASVNGFWIALEDRVTAYDHNLKIRFHNNNGVLAHEATIASNLNMNSNPSVAVMGDGRVVVAWSKNNYVSSEIWRAIYNSNGTVFAAPAVVDNVGWTNRNVDVVSTGSGFAMVYEDSEWSGGNLDITLKRFNTLGALLGTTNLSDPGATDLSHESTPAIARLANGILVVGWGDDRFDNAGTDTDTIVYLVDPNTGTRLTNADGQPEGRQVIGSAGDYVGFDVGGVTIAGSSNGGINVFHRNNTNADVDGESLAVRRTWTGQSTGDTMNGDFFIDIMNGNAGNDILRGGDNNDELNGGTGNDDLNGERGTDVLTGGADADKFLFTSPSHSVPGLGRDQIIDFSRLLGDKIDVSAIDGMTGTPGLNGFSLTTGNGSGPFTAEGQIRVTSDGNDAIVQFNVTGTSQAEMEITLVGFFVAHTQLQLSDFVFGGNMSMLAAQVPQSSMTQVNRQQVNRQQILPTRLPTTDAPVTVAKVQSAVGTELPASGSDATTPKKNTTPRKRSAAGLAPVNRSSSMSTSTETTATFTPRHLDAIFASDDLSLI